MILPLFLGIMIYALFRNTSGLIVSEYWGLHSENKANFSIPNFIKYNLPDGLWLFAFTNAIIFIWKSELNRQSIIWICSIPIIAFSTEILQAKKLFIGTYDAMDLAVYSIASFLSFKLCKIKFLFSINNLNKMKNIQKHLLSFLVLASAIALLLASSPQKKTVKMSFTFDHAPKGTVAPGSADISIALVKPYFADDWKILENIDLFSRYRDGLNGDVEELLIAKGFTLKGPYDQKADMTYTDKKTAALALDIRIIPSINKSALKSTGSVKHGFHYSGLLIFGGRIELSAYEPLSGEKVWSKSAELPTQNNIAVITDRAYTGEATLLDLFEDGGFYNPIGQAMQKSYDTALNKLEGYIEKEEFRALLPQVKELKNRKN